jgi:hypothetical protein
MWVFFTDKCNITLKTDNTIAKRITTRTNNVPHSLRITGFVTRVTRRVPIFEHELPWKNGKTKQDKRTNNDQLNTAQKRKGKTAHHEPH